MNQPIAGHHMLDEIREQPQAIARLLDAEEAHVWAMAERWHRQPPRFIFLAARGTSDHVALYGKYLFETLTGIPTGLAAPSVASIYQAKLRVEGGLFIGISQSGEAADVIAVLEQARAAGADTLAITNIADSPLTSAADDTICLHAHPEIAVAATKTYSSSLAALLLLTAAMARREPLRAQLRQVPALLQEVLGMAAQVQARVERFRYLEECVVLGRGYNLGTAYEMALKLRETSYIRAQPFASPDFVHGPIAIIQPGYPVIAIANEGATLPSVLEVLSALRTRGAEAVIIGNARAALDVADVAFPINTAQPVPELLSPFPSTVAAQLFAHALAVLKGNNPDKPRGLNKVTITR